MYNMVKYLLLLTAVVFIIVDCEITYGCYRQPSSPCSQHTLTCPGDQVIVVDDTGNYVNIAYGRKKSGFDCHQDQMEICNATCCRHEGRNEDVNYIIPVNQSDRLSVYRSCSNQPTCTVTSPYSPDTDYDYVLYVYTCLPAVLVYNMIEITDVSFPLQGYLYYSGKTQTTSTTITRCCNITSTEPIQVEIVYIYLTEESSYNVKIYSENQTLLRGVYGGGIFYGYRELSISGDTIYHVVLDNFIVEEDDYIWLKIESNSNISITCGECSGFTDSATATDSKNSSNEVTTSKDNNNRDVITGLTVGIIVVCLLLVVTWFIAGVYCSRRKMKRTQHPREGQNIARPVNSVETSTYAGLVNNGGSEHGYSGLVNPNLVNLNRPDTVNNSGPERDHTGLVNRNGTDTMNSGGSEHDYTGLENRNGSDNVDNSGPEHGYINMVNRNGSDNSDPEHSTVPNETEHHYTALSNPMHVPTDVNYENTLANTN